MPVPASALTAFVPAAARGVFAAGDDSGPPLRAAARLRRPRRDYMGREAGPAPSVPDSMGGGAARTILTPERVTPERAAPAPLAYLGTSAYGLTSRQAAAPVAVRARTYGLEAGVGLRAVRGARAIEAGDAVTSMPPAFALEPTSHQEPSEPVGRFYPAPTERVQAAAPVLPGRRERASSPLLVAALTASVTTSVLAFFLRPYR